KGKHTPITWRKRSGMDSARRRAYTSRYAPYPAPERSWDRLPRSGADCVGGGVAIAFHVARSPPYSGDRVTADRAARHRRREPRDAAGQRFADEYGDAELQPLPDGNEGGCRPAVCCPVREPRDRARTS